MFHVPHCGRRGSALEPLPRRLGFTLVEVLVVLGIIAALLGILIPSVAAARREADAVVCTANIRTISAAALMYAQQNKRYVAFVSFGTIRIDRKELLLPYMTQGRSNRENEAGQAWQCPANDRMAIDNVQAEASYGFNTNMNAVRLERVRKPTETVALCDAGLMDMPSTDVNAARATHCWPPGRPATTSSCRPNHLRHRNNMVSVGFVDGHAERLPMSPPFYPGPMGTYTPSNVAPSHPNYQDRLWDLN